MLSLTGLILAALVFGSTYYYLKAKDKDYDSLIGRAAKKQKDHSEFTEFYGEVEPNIPNKDENSQTLLGIDSNNNGVRDDIDVWINRSALTQNESLSMRQYARARQDWLRVCDQNLLDQVIVVNKKVENATTCLTMMSDYKRREKNYAKDKLELLILNIKSRIDCHEFYAKNSKTTPIAVGENTNFSCEFKVQYPENVVSGNEEWNKKSSSK